MTATASGNIAAAPALAWVRHAWTAMAELTIASTIGGEKETRRVAKADEAVLSDVSAAATGDGDAYARIIDRYQVTIARRMVRFTRDPQMIEELVHDVFVEAYFSVASYRGDAPFEHWLQRIATRVGYRHWTRRGREPKTIDVHLHEPESQANTAAGESLEQVALALEQLAPRDGLVLTLLYLESRSVAEAAELAGWSTTMVKVQAHRARKKLRKLLEPKEPTDG